MAQLSTLVIGYGNTIRSDDGAGQAVAEALATHALPGVRTQTVHQLTPDLAADLATVDRVIFVDAVPWLEDTPPTVQIQPLKPQLTNTSLGHHCEPAALLALSAALYNHVPEAYWVLIPAVSLEFGETLSEQTRLAVAIAINEVLKLHALEQTVNSEP